MDTSTIVILGVVAVAGVGGVIYWQHTKTLKALAAAKAAAGGKSTTDKIVGTVAASIPIIGSIVGLWA